jgi:hypothetical protein
MARDHELACTPSSRLSCKGCSCRASRNSRGGIASSSEFHAIANWSRTELAYMNEKEHPELELAPRMPMPQPLFDLRDCTRAKEQGSKESRAQARQATPSERHTDANAASEAQEMSAEQIHAQAVELVIEIHGVLTERVRARPIAGSRARRARELALPRAHPRSHAGLSPRATGADLRGLHRAAAAPRERLSLDAHLSRSRRRP